MANFDSYIDNNYEATLPQADLPYGPSASQKIKDLLYKDGEVSLWEGIKATAGEAFDRMPSVMATKDEMIGKAGGLITDEDEFNPYKYDPNDPRFDTPQTMVRPFGEVVDPDYEVDGNNIVKKQRTKLTESEWKESKYYHPELSFPDGVYEGVASIMKEEKDKEVARREILEKAPSGLIPLATEFIVGMGAEFTDPVNIGLMSVPVVGEGKWLAALGKNRYVQSAARGAVEGFVGNIPAEAIAYSGEQMLQGKYTLADSMFNTVIGTTAGAGLGVVGRAAKDVHAKYKKNYAEKEALVNKTLADFEEDNTPTFDLYSDAQDIQKISPDDLKVDQVINDAIKEVETIVFPEQPRGKYTDLVIPDLDIPVARKDFDSTLGKFEIYSESGSGVAMKTLPDVAKKSFKQYLTTEQYDNLWQLTDIITRGKEKDAGDYGKKLMDFVETFADENDKAIVLYTNPGGHNGRLNQQQLIDWYTRHGFEMIDYVHPWMPERSWMIRKPNQGIKELAQPGNIYSDVELERLVPDVNIEEASKLALMTEEEIMASGKSQFEINMDLHTKKALFDSHYYRADFWRYELPEDYKSKQSIVDAAVRFYRDTKEGRAGLKKFVADTREGVLNAPEDQRLSIKRFLEDNGVDDFELKTKEEVKAEVKEAKTKFETIETTRPWFNKEESDRYNLYKNGVEVEDPIQRARMIHRAEMKDPDFELNVWRRENIDAVNIKYAVSDETKISKFNNSFNGIRYWMNGILDMDPDADLTAVNAKILGLRGINPEELTEEALDKLVREALLTSEFNYGGTHAEKIDIFNGIKKAIDERLTELSTTREHSNALASVDKAYDNKSTARLKELQDESNKRFLAFSKDVEKFINDNDIEVGPNDRTLNDVIVGERNKASNKTKEVSDGEKMRLARRVAARKVKSESIPEKEVIKNLKVSGKFNPELRDYAAVLTGKLNSANIKRLWLSGDFDFMPNPAGMKSIADKVGLWNKNIKEAQDQVWIQLAKLQDIPVDDLIDPSDAIDIRSKEIGEGIKEDIAQKPENKTYLKDMEPREQTAEEIVDLTYSGEKGQLDAQIADLSEYMLYSVGQEEEVPAGMSVAEWAKANGMTDTQLKILNEEYDEIMKTSRDLKTNYNKILDAAKDC